MWRVRRNTTDRDALSLVVHGPEFRNGELLVLNPDLFPEVKLHDLVEIAQTERVHPRLVLAVESLAPVRGKLQVSVAKDVAAQFGLEAFRSVTVRRVEPRDVSVDFVELSFKDQFLSRADVWRFKVTMLGQCVYVGRTVECLGIRSQVDAVLASNTHLHCGVIGESTKIVVRSRSSRLFWLVQMSTEMWEFAPDGEIYYEKLLNRLLRVLITKWSESSVTHSITIIAFSRSFYDANQFPDGFDPTKAPFSDPKRQGFGPGCGAPDINMANGYGPTIHVDPVSGLYYEDFYKVVVMNYTGPDWSRLLLLLKEEFASYYETHRWRTPEEISTAQYEICRCPKLASNTDEKENNSIPGAAKDNPDNPEDCMCDDLYVKWTKLPSGVPSRAKDGNILEAINVTLNVLDKHYMDRDLSRTGQGIVMMTAGCSIFNVNSKLAEITEQRMMDNGVGMDMISLSTPPLHVVPLFIYSNTPSTRTEESNSEIPNLQRKLSF
ncbi:Vacuolar membrane-associated protein, partial [Phytophthora palmivora]